MTRHNPTRVLGVLAGADMPEPQLRAWVESAEVVLAADGGANLLYSLGVIPTAVIGDMDSILPEVAAAQKELIPYEDQDKSDCDKLLELAGSLGYGRFTLAGVEGDLLDHVLGIVQSVARSDMEVRLALRRGTGRVIRGPFGMTLRTTPGKRFSVIPLTVCRGVTLVGTRWPLQDSMLDPFGLTSLSNICEADEVKLSLSVGNAFVFSETHGQPLWGEEDSHRWL